MGVHNRIGSLCTLDNCGEVHDAAPWEPPPAKLYLEMPNMLELARRLEVEEAQDLGLQFCRNGDGTCGTYYVTALFWRCAKCRCVVECVSQLERRFALEMGLAGEHLVAARLQQDQEALRCSRDHHRCQPRPAFAFRQDGG